MKCKECKEVKEIRDIGLFEEIGISDYKCPITDEWHDGEDECDVIKEVFE